MMCERRESCVRDECVMCERIESCVRDDCVMNEGGMCDT